MEEESKKNLAFGKLNYIIMLVGLIVLAIGFLTMASGTEKDVFERQQMTLGPIILMIGFLIQFVAILYKPKKD